MGKRGEKRRPKLKTPYYPSDGQSKAYFDNPSNDIKVVSDYTGLSFGQVEKLDIFENFGYLHDAVVWNCQRTETGREYLENAYNYAQTKPDRAALRAHFGGE